MFSQCLLRSKFFHDTLVLQIRQVNTEKHEAAGGGKAHLNATVKNKDQGNEHELGNKVTRYYLK